MNDLDERFFHNEVQFHAVALPACKTSCLSVENVNETPVTD